MIDVFDVGADPSNFDDALRRAIARYDLASHRILVWFEGSAPGEASPWCPDTERALPVMERALYRGSGVPIVLITCNVASKSELQQPSYAYRTDPRLQLKGVPTLFRWGELGPVQRLECGSQGCGPEWSAAEGGAAIDALIGI